MIEVRFDEKLILDYEDRNIILKFEAKEYTAKLDFMLKKKRYVVYPFGTPEIMKVIGSLKVKYPNSTEVDILESIYPVKLQIPLAKYYIVRDFLSSKGVDLTINAKNMVVRSERARELTDKINYLTPRYSEIEVNSQTKEVVEFRWVPYMNSPNYITLGVSMIISGLVYELRQTYDGYSDENIIATERGVFYNSRGWTRKNRAKILKLSGELDNYYSVFDKYDKLKGVRKLSVIVGEYENAIQRYTLPDSIIIDKTMGEENTIDKEVAFRLLDAFDFTTDDVTTLLEELIFNKTNLDNDILLI